ncbi:hypothetical protein EJ08DRAFT_698595 [Tothia fuscella]|uniref:Uncharacterized protein n=1 Tax=Tothia fuscella TaxID=1048955 RepID=A0A9P4NPC1_9PEZI|nr:hypothetical protein EJ08DRAFT_698595 [Tothia fuscella]
MTTADLMSPGGPLFRKPGTTHAQFCDSWNRHAQLNVLQQADGVAFVQCRSLRTVAGLLQPFGDGGKHPYFATTIAVDERRFLHEESGATAIKNDQPLFDIPALDVDEWKRLALGMGGIEHVKIRSGKAVIAGLWWREWEDICKEENKRCI